MNSFSITLQRLNQTGGNPKESIKKEFQNFKFVTNGKHISYLNVPVSFDIETTSFERDLRISEKKTIKEKCSLMYAFVFGINGRCVLGRNWDEFMEITDELVKRYELNEKRRVIIYVHNLAYEFQFIRKRFEWLEVFANSERETLYCVTKNGIEFRCSYMLSGYSLEYIGKEILKKYKVEKLVGNLDYKLLRHTKTELTEKEISYIINDGLVVMAYIMEEIERNGSIIRLPLTKTGYVRKYVRDSCLYEGSHKNNVNKFTDYYKSMQTLKLSLTDYKMLKRTFHGGFTHANPLYSGVTIKDVVSMDFTSSYPSVMISESEFPLNSFRPVKIKNMEHFTSLLNNYCCIFDIRMINVRKRLPYDSPISESKCIELLGKRVVDNGRIVSADNLLTTLTNIDYEVIKDFYEWDSMKIYNMRVSDKGYLPTRFVKAILELYQQKTTLKDVEGKEVEYMVSKGMLNSCFGMAVTDVIRDKIEYNNNEWESTPPTNDEYITMLEKYNNQKNRFLFYGWGIFTTSLAQRNLFDGIKNIGNDYIYSDTDSVKIRNYEEHKKYFEDYNEQQIEKLKKALEFHKIPIEYGIPKTIKGVEKPLGVWDFDGHYKYFRCLRAKCYMYIKDNDEISLTISGVNKKTAIPYLKDKYKDNLKILKELKDGFSVPVGFCGKSAHTYIDYTQTGILTDYKGVTSEFSELSSVHLSEVGYNLNLEVDYMEYLMGLRGIK